MNIEHDTLRIPGLSRTYRFLQISDSHIYAHSPDNDELDRIYTEERIREHAWQSTDKTPMEELAEALAFADREGMDAVLAAGDLVDYVSPGNSLFLKQQFSKTRTEVLYAFGNHEGGHGKREVIHRDCYPMYDGLMPGSPDFWVKDYGELKVIGMDDSDHRLTRKQMDALLEQCRGGTPVLLVVHTPLAAEDIRPRVLEAWKSSAPWFMLGYDEREAPAETAEFYDFVMQPDSPIRAVIAGHIHFAHTGSLPGEGRMQFVSAPTCTGYARYLTVTP